MQGRKMTEHVEHRLQHGAEYPYDASDAWWASKQRRKPPKPKDWAHEAARGIVADLKDRRGIKWGFDDIDEDVRKEIVATIASIIRLAAGRTALSDGRGER